MIWIWISMITASFAGRILVEETSNLQPCPFNLLCRCSRGGPEVGLIYCEDIPLAQVPLAINNTKAFALNLRRNELHRLEENVFHGTGSLIIPSLSLVLYKINIQHWPIRPNYKFLGRLREKNYR